MAQRSGRGLAASKHALEPIVTQAYLNRVAIAVPKHEVHDTILRFAERCLRDRRSRLLFDRMVSRSEIRQRWSCLEPAAAGSNDRLDVDGFYALGGSSAMRKMLQCWRPLRTSRISSSRHAPDYPPRGRF
jgi:hypothetical protein